MDPRLMPDNVAARSEEAMQATVHSGGQSNQFRFDLGRNATILAWVQLIVIVLFGYLFILAQRDLTKAEVEHSKQTAMYEERMKTLELSNLALDRQYRMAELKLDDWTVVAHRSGLVLPGDYTRGPQGNLDREAFNLKPTR